MGVLEGGTRAAYGSAFASAPASATVVDDGGDERRDFAPRGAMILG
jgi:hypothetical protein